MTRLRLVADEAPRGMPWGLRLVLVLGAVVWFFAIVGVRSLFAQVAPVITIVHGDAVTVVNNPSSQPVGVTVALFRDTTTADRIGAAVPAIVSPSAFQLAAGSSQTVRIRLRGPGAPVLRLVWTFTPPATPRGAGVHLTMVTRIAAKVLVTP